MSQRRPQMQEAIIAKKEAFLSAEKKFNEIVVTLSRGEMMGKEHSKIELYLKTEGFELLRRMMQAHLELRCQQEQRTEVIDANVITMTRVRQTERSLETIFGKVIVERKAYSKKGKTCLHPLDGELNLAPELYSHGVREIVAKQAAKESFSEVVKTLTSTTGATLAKRQAEELANRAAVDFDAFYQQRCNQNQNQAEKVQTSAVLVITSDGKGVVMHNQDLREPTRKAALAHMPKMEHRLSRGEKRNSKRMATVASVYTIEPYIRTPQEIMGQLHPIHQREKQRPKPEQKRVWASVEKDAEEVIGAAFAEGISRDPEKTKKWVAVVDGNEKQLELMEAFAIKHSIILVIILDLIHVLEYLWKASYVFNEKESKEAEIWVNERLLEILQGRSSDVAIGIDRSANLLDLDCKQREPADKCKDYLLKYASYLRYDQYLAQGLPIASGVIEGACRYLVKDRMDLTGARWRLLGAEAVLKLRSLSASGDFDDYWHFHLLNELQRNHKSKYADGFVPLQPALSFHLRLVM